VFTLMTLKRLHLFFVSLLDVHLNSIPANRERLGVFLCPQPVFLALLGTRAMRERILAEAPEGGGQHRRVAVIEVREETAAR
jgi:uncharacterized membrane protein YidH (DUF202 family)